MDSRRIVWFEALTRADVAEVGGKNASLGEMGRNLAGQGVEVPPGFATRAAAFWRFVEANGLKDVVRSALDDLAAGKVGLQEAGQTIRRAVPARAGSEAIVEGHGDLRPEHVYLLDDGPRVLDCLEFSRVLRAIDPVDELSFLALECERLGDRAPGATLLAACERASGRPAGDGLVAFYTAFRALQRARFAVAHLDDAPSEAAPMWRARAAGYLDRARAARRAG